MKNEVETFILEHVYDPVKRRQYYLRTRELKGRRNGGTDASSSRVGRPKSVGVREGESGIADPQSDRTRAEVKARVNALKNRLEKLKTLLDELVEQAKKRSGVETKKETPKKESLSIKDTKPATAKEKREAKERYEKEQAKNPSLKKEEAQLQAEIAEIREKITKVRDDLKAAVKNARRKATQIKTAKQTTRPLERNSQNGS